MVRSEEGVVVEGCEYCDESKRKYLWYMCGSERESVRKGQGESEIDFDRVRRDKVMGQTERRK